MRNFIILIIFQIFLCSNISDIYSLAPSLQINDIVDKKIELSELKKIPDSYITALKEFVGKNIRIIKVVKLGGSRASTYKITFKIDIDNEIILKTYILKKEPQKGKAIKYMIRISKYLRKNNLPYPEYILKNSAEFCEIDDEIYTCQKAIKGEVLNWGMISNAMLEKLSELLAEIHKKSIGYKELKDEESFQLGEDKNFKQIEDIDNLKEELFNLLKLVKKENVQNSKYLKNEDKQKMISLAIEEKDYIEKVIKELSDFEILDKRFRVHGDFVNANLLADGDNITGVIDLERSRANASRWEDLCRPVFHFPGLEIFKFKTFNFDRFALWITAYNKEFKDSNLKFTEKELSAEFLRKISILMYLREINVGLKNRKGFTGYLFLKEQIENLRGVINVKNIDWKSLSVFLKNAAIWNVKTLDPEIIIKNEGKFKMAA